MHVRGDALVLPDELDEGALLLLECIDQPLLLVDGVESTNGRWPLVGQDPLHQALRLLKHELLLRRFQKPFVLHGQFDNF